LNKFVSKQQVLVMIESGSLVITSYVRQIEYLRFYGDTDIAAGSETVAWGGTMPNAGKTEHLRFTGIWLPGIAEPLRAAAPLIRLASLNVPTCPFVADVNNDR
jgi:hypothetical protein